MASRPTEMSRGVLATQTGVNSETIRYYEKIGLMPDPARSSAGHRVYNESHAKRLSFVRRSRELGFTLEEIRELLELVDGGDYTCADVRDRTLTHLDDISKRIQDLQKLQRKLKSMAAKCDGGSAPECPIVDALYSD